MAVAYYLGETCPPLPDISKIKFPGLDRYKKLGFHTKARPYQPAAISFVSSRAYGFLSDDCRSGKTFDIIASTVLCDAKKVLISTPDFVKRVWATEIATLTGEEPAILYGRGADEVRVFCKTCIGRGRLHGSEADKIVAAHEASEAERQTKTKRKLKKRWPDLRCPDCRAENGQALGARIYKDEWVHDAIAKSRYVITNPDLLIAQMAKTLPGVEYVDMTLPGWCPALAKHKFEWVVADESHNNFRHIQLSAYNKGHLSKRDKMIELAQGVERFICVTATPMVGFVRDFWPQLDLMSGGIWGSKYAPRLPWSFGSSYCASGKDAHDHWHWDGRSERADTELAGRLKVLKIQRPLEELAKDMPPVTRQVIRVDINTAKQDRIKRKNESAASTFIRLVRRAGDYKRPVVIENVLNEMSAGHKSIVFCKCEESVETFAQRLSEEIAKRQWAPRMRQVNGEVWAVHGDFSSGKSEDTKKPLKGGSEKMRHEAGRMFREHRGAACFVASIDAFQLGVSLKGATTIHFLEYHASPGCMFQAERRPREIGTTGLTILYYIAVGTIDDRLEYTLLPKVASMDAMKQDLGAGQVLDAFGVKPVEMPIDLDSLIAELCSTREEY